MTSKNLFVSLTSSYEKDLIYSPCLLLSRLKLLSVDREITALDLTEKF